jgi:hypothetical protein
MIYVTRLLSKVVDKLREALNHQKSAIHAACGTDQKNNSFGNCFEISILAVEAMGIWESQRDFQGRW